jgi:hypothetical protein
MSVGAQAGTTDIHIIIHIRSRDAYHTSASFIEPCCYVLLVIAGRIFLLLAQMSRIGNRSFPISCFNVGVSDYKQPGVQDIPDDRALGRGHLRVQLDDLVYFI